MGLCQYVDLCFHASSLPCLHTFWHAIPTSFYIFNVFFFLSLVIYVNHSKEVYMAAETKVRGSFAVNIPRAEGRGIFTANFK